MKTHMPNVLYCSVHECAYNEEDSCHAMAITVDSPEPLCDTFFDSGRKGGLKDFTATVGACKNGTCVHNESLECTAAGIKVSKHENKAECDTFSRT